MIDPKQPPPGREVDPRCGSLPGGPFEKFHRLNDSVYLDDAHRIYAAESQPAVIDFAERLALWVRSGAAAREWEQLGSINPREFIVEQVLNAANGERTLP